MKVIHASWILSRPGYMYVLCVSQLAAACTAMAQVAKLNTKSSKTGTWLAADLMEIFTEHVQ